MNVGSMLLWGFAATALLTVLLTAGRLLGYTRMDLPVLVGTIFHPGRDGSRKIGFLLYYLNGMIIAALYCAVFESWQVATWWAGSAIALLHAAFLLLPGMSLMPSLHPRMANEEHGPTPTKQLEPPGPLAVNYGRLTPVVVLVAHLGYGALLGAFYRLH